MDEGQKQWRAHALLFGAFVGFGLLAVALGSLQLLHHDHFATLARANRQFHRRIPAPRGIISDRDGVALAENDYHARITYPRRLVGPEDPVLARLIELLDLPRDRVLERLERSSEPDRLTVVRRASPRQIAVVEEHRLELPYVQLAIQPRRRYPFGSLAAHVLGYVGEVRGEETGPGSFYLPGDVIGRQGIERYAESQLRGRHGQKVVEVNAAGHDVGEIPEGTEPALPGVHLYLTLSRVLQERLEELMEGRSGSGVVIEVSTGDILAAASMPSYDPNELTGGVSVERMREITSDRRKILFDRTLRGAYPPGSPFKLITAAAALERGYVTPQTRFEPCWGKYRFGNREFRCWKEYGHGSLDLEGAIVQSCDVYFYQLGQKLTVDELAETARQFGFGAVTGLEELTESPGLVPTESWYDEKEGTGGWTAGVKLNLAIGQGELLATPLQMARCYAAIGGDGHLYRPHLILVRENVYGVRDNRRIRRVAQPICSERTRRFLRRSLRRVVGQREGTGGLARVAGVDVSGKTGTVENAFGDDHAWFIAYAPSEQPEVAVALIVENAGHGGDVAAPMVRELLKTYFDTRDQVELSERAQPRRQGEGR